MKNNLWIALASCAFAALPALAQTNSLGPGTNQSSSEQVASSTFVLPTPPETPAPNEGPILVSGFPAPGGVSGARQIRADVGGASADYGLHAVHFALNANTDGALQVRLPGGPGATTLGSHIIGLCYWEHDGNGRSAMIATVTDSEGIILPPNRVLYRKALGDGYDLLYSYSELSIEADLVIHKRLPRPQDVLPGADPANIWVGVVHEFVNPPQPLRRPHPVNVPVGPALASETLPGEEIHFGFSRILGEGRAFALGSTGPSVPTATAWHEDSGRSFVVDFTPYRVIESEIESLPQGVLESRYQPKKSLRTMLAETSAPARRPAAEKEMLLAQAGSKLDKGVVIDYVLVSSPILDVSFGGAKAGFAAIGQTNIDYWNHYSAAGASVGVLTNLLWTTTNGSSVGLIVSNAPGVVSNGFALDPMYAQNVCPTNGGSISVTLTNLPSNVYDFYFYGHGSNLLSDSIFYLYRAGTQLGVKYTTQWSQKWATTNWEPGIQYVVFHSVSVTNQTIQVTVSPGGDSTAYLSGLQIAASGAIAAPTLNISNLININFGADAGYKTGFAAVGLTTNDFWNGIMARANVGTIVGLTNSAHTATGTGLVLLGAPGVWNDSVPDTMYQNYDYATSGNAWVVLTNLAAGNYDFYCYGHSGSDSDNAFFEVWAGDRASDVRPTTMLGSGWNSVVWDEGQQYVVFRNVQVKTNETVSVQVGHSSINYATINGIQIVYKGSADPGGNGLPDAWELYYFGNTNQTATGDFDGDYISNTREYELGLDPTVPNTNANTGEIVWMEDAVPAGGYTSTSGDSWNWASTWTNNGVLVTPYSGSLMQVSSLTSGTHYCEFYYADMNLEINTNDYLICYVNPDAANPPAEIMLQWYVTTSSGSGSWEHRAYWGANDITSLGTDGTTSRTNVTPFPTSGQWTRLQVPASAVGLQGQVVQGLALTLYNGRAAFDRGGKLNPSVDDLNGLPDAWQIEYFGGLGVNPNAAALGDGLSIYQKYVLGLNPTQAVLPDTNGLVNLQVYTPLK